MKDESNSESLAESSILPGKENFGRDESVTQSRLLAGGTSR
jgi:hypothetical protein